MTGEDAPPVPLAFFFLGEQATTFSFPVGTHTETNYVQGTPDPVVEHIAPLSTEHDGIVFCERMYGTQTCDRARDIRRRHFLVVLAW